ncbi:MAG: DUF2341 domain-containing protein, partial [Candidatus Thermoplasmatota archaeon]|nr:DUF2341 domain-containing protein [Candidatus Thermoplasmatota archaeon]
VMGNSKLEIVGANNNIVRIYNGTTFEVMDTINTGAIASTLVQDITGNGRNELILISSSGTIKVYETSAYAPTPRVRTNSLYYSERNTGAGVYIPPPGAIQPILKEEYPVNNSMNIPLNPTLSIHAVNYQINTFHNDYVVEHAYDPMYITISTNASGTWEEVAWFNDASNARYNYTPDNMDDKGILYYWRVTAVNTFTGVTNTETFRFRTIPPDINTSVNTILPYYTSILPLMITATNHADPVDNITLRYRYTTDNLTFIENWYRNNWNYRKQITINSSQITDDLNNFPILVSITDMELRNHAQSNGNDILFTNATGIKLNHEIELYNSSNGELVAWVNITNLKHNEDTTIYMYYGNSLCDNQENVSGTWDSEYLAVHHFSETSGQHLDSTSSAYDSIKVDVTTQGSAAGIVGGANYLDGNNTFIQFQNKVFTAGKNEVLIEMWINPDTWSTSNMIYDEWNGADYWQFSINQGKFHTRDVSTGPTGSRDNDINWSSPLTNKTWNHVAFWYSVSNNAKKIFLNGLEDASTSISIDQLTIHRDLNSPRIGYASDGTNYAGYVDEFRVSKIARSADWIQTTYNTINNPETFISVSEQEFNWITWNNSTNPSSSPFSWQFNFPNGTGYYEFYSIGAKNDFYEDSKTSADALCHYTETEEWQNTCPRSTNEFPLNKSLDVAVYVESWSISISDADGNTTSGTIVCSSGDTMSWTDQENSTQSLNLSTLDYETNYTVWINYTDGHCQMNETFWFITNRHKEKHSISLSENWNKIS